MLKIKTIKQFLEQDDKAPPSGKAGSAQSGGKKSLEDALGILQSGFVKGSGAGFLKGTGEMIKGTTAVSREVRVGVAHVKSLSIN
jgi:hypothetical protein